MAEQELKIRLEIEGKGADSIKDMEASIRELTNVWKGLSTEGRKASPELARAIEQMKNTKNDAMIPLRSENDKMMRSYFMLGQQMRAMLVPLMQLPPGIGTVVTGMMGMFKTMTLVQRAGGGVTALFTTMQTLIFSPTGILLGIGLVTAAFAALSKKTDDNVKSQKNLNDEFERQNELRHGILELRRELGQVSGEEYVAELQRELTLLQTELERLDVMERIARFGATDKPLELSREAVIAGTKRPAIAAPVATAVTPGVVGEAEMTTSSRILEIKKRLLEIEKQITGEMEDQQMAGMTGENRAQRDAERYVERRKREIAARNEERAEERERRNQERERQRDSMQMFAIQQSGAQAVGAEIRSSVGRAWESVFGEANSLLEIYLSRVASGLIEAFGGTLLNQISAGLGTALGFTSLGRAIPRSYDSMSKPTIQLIPIIKDTGLSIMVKTGGRKQSLRTYG